MESPVIPVCFITMSNGAWTFPRTPWDEVGNGPAILVSTQRRAKSKRSAMATSCKAHSKHIIAKSVRAKPVRPCLQKEGREQLRNTPDGLLVHSYTYVNTPTQTHAYTTLNNTHTHTHRPCWVRGQTMLLNDETESHRCRLVLSSRTASVWHPCRTVQVPLPSCTW